MNPRKILISGQFEESGNLFPVLEPHSGKEYCEVYSGVSADIQTAIDAANSAKRDLKQITSNALSEGLGRMSDLIRDRREEFAQAISRESGKPIRYAEGEVKRAIDTFRIASQEVLRFGGEVVETERSEASLNTEARTYFEPKGLVVGIAPFNFPLNLVAHKVAPAIASRNPIIIKPSEKTPVSSLMLGEVFLRSGLPKTALQVIPFELPVLDKLLKHDDVRIISFTGSDKVGWALKSEHGRKDVLLELGGNAPVIVDANVDLESVAERIVFGGFAYSGQVCISVQRVIAVESIFEELLDLVTEKVRDLKRGNPLEPDTEISEMISVKAAESTESLIREAISAGAKVEIGGNRDGAFVEPTIMSNVAPDSPLYRQEAFAPVVIFEMVEAFETAIERANDSRFGLQAGVFTDSIRHRDLAVRELQYGGVILNDVPTFRVDNMPYGGIKDSGNTREGVRFAMEEMSEIKLVVKRRSL